MTLKIWKLPFKPTTQSPPELKSDIPEALRDAPAPSPRQWVRPALFLTGGLGLGAIIVLSCVLIISQLTRQSVTATSTPGSGTPEKTGVEVSLPDRKTIVTGDRASEVMPSPVKISDAPVENVLGHLPYKVAPQSELEAITADGRLRLRKAAARKYKEMEAAARADGIRLAAISAFRTVEEQNRLFFDVKAQRNQNSSDRAAVSAPPGYSEHHTGYAIDIGDARVPATNLRTDFEKTAAFKWLEKNAARYSFELSFPRNNPQGVSYEPWHWRYSGDIKSLEMFHRAHNLPENNE